jgi:hypothetical protein
VIGLGGLPFLSLLGIFAVVGSATLALYVLKLRRRSMVVPFAPLWRRVLRDQEASELWSRLKRIFSLLLQLFLLALLIFALGDPRPTARRAAARNVVVLLDASASMKAHDLEPSRIEVAKERVNALVDGLGSGDRMLIAEMDADLTPLSTMSSDTLELKEAVRRVRASDTAADLTRGLLFARDSLRGLEGAEILIVSDGALGDLKESGKGVDLAGARVSFVPIGESGDNVAISQFSVRRYPLDKSRYEVFLELCNTTERKVEIELSLLGDGQVVDVSRVELEPKQTLPRFYQDLAGASRTLEARIKPLGDAIDRLPADDHAYALMPERRRTRVLVVSPGNTYLEAALLLDEYLEVTWIDDRAKAPAAHFDVAVLDGTVPPEATQADAYLYLATPATGGPVKLRRVIEDFGFDEWDRKSPLLRWIALENVQVSTGYALEPERGDKVVGSSELGPILVSGNRAGHPFVALGFEPKNSDLVLRVAWPLFLLNTIDAFVEEDSQYLSSYRTGEIWQLPVPGAATTVELKGPDGQIDKLAVKSGRATYFGRNAGFYELSVGDGSERSTTLFAANLSDIDESHITPKKELTLGSVPLAAAQGFGAGARQELWHYLVLAGFVLSVIEWATYHRRVTV